MGEEVLRFRVGLGVPLRWTPMFEPLGAFFKLAFFEAAPVFFGSRARRASIILERENDEA